MEYVNLRDICKINMGQSPESTSYNSDKQGVPFYQGNADFGALYPNPRIWCSKPIKLAKENDILISVRAPVGALNFSKEECCIGRGLAAITLDSNDFLLEFIYWSLRTGVKELQSKSTGSTFKSINKKTLEEVRIPKISLKEQKDIIRNLTLLTNILAKYKHEIVFLDELVKARFVEMFGDPIYNTQNRPMTEFINVVKMQRGYDLPVQDRNHEGSIPVYGANGVLGYHDVAKINNGGIITGRSGTIGKVYLANKEYWPLNTSLFSIETYGNNLIYLQYLVTLYDLKRFVEGTGVPTLNRNMFHNKKIIEVPINEQNTFASFVEEVDKSRLLSNHSLFLIKSITF